MKHHDLWFYADVVDLDAADAHQRGGALYLNWVLATPDRIEHALSRRGSVFALQQVGDWSMFGALRTTRPPEHGSVPPEGDPAAPRNQSKIQH